MRSTWILTAGILCAGVLSAADYAQLRIEAEKAAEAKDFVTAEAKYGEAVEAAPDSKEKTQAILGKFQAMRAQKKVKDAEDFVLGSVEDDAIRTEDARHILNTLVETMLRRPDREDRAMDLLRQAQNCECPQSSNVYYRTFYYMASLYGKKQEYQAQIDVLENVLRAKGQHLANLYTAHLMTGGAYEKLELPEEALKHYRLALEYGKKVKYKFDITSAEKAVERMSK